MIIDGNADGLLDRNDTVKVTTNNGLFSVIYLPDFPDYSEKITNNIKIYPNPSNGAVNISDLEVRGRMQVFNNLGIVIHKFKIQSNTESLSLSTQPDGIYLICTFDTEYKQVGCYKLLEK